MAKTKYTATLEANGTKYEAKGDTPFDALKAIPLDYVEVKTKGTLGLEYGKKTSERFFPLNPLRRLFANKDRMMGVSRDLEYLLDN
jgi:hypothetical protein